MDMQMLTTGEWKEEAWRRAEPVYREAFPHGAKPEGIVKRMLDRGIGSLHLLVQGENTLGMAVTGLAAGGPDKLLIIDYLAVRTDLRGQGIGRRFLNMIVEWAVREHRVSGILIEVEAGDTPEHEARYHFWEKCGFIRTSYVHSYIWVPEPYSAMLLPLDPSLNIGDDGRRLFRYIENFHKRSFRP